MSEQRFGALADRYARQYGVPPKLFRLLISAESSWNPNAVSGAGARGLTQVVPRWHPSADLSTPAGQLQYGAKHLGSLLKKYGNPRDALAVYNSGRPWAQSQNISETRNYVTKILGQLGSGGGPVPPSGGESPAGPPPGGGASPPSGGSGIDARALMQALKQSREGVLQGQAPGKDFGRNLHGLVSRALANPVRVQPSEGGQPPAAPSAPNTAGGADIAPILPGAPQWGSYGYGDPEGQGGKHLAVDWFADHGVPAKAPASGTIVRLTPHQSGNRTLSGQVYGGVLAIRDSKGRLHVLRHIDPRSNLRQGQKVRAGDHIGTPTRWSGGDHVHYETYKPGSSDREYGPTFAMNPRDVIGGVFR